MISPLRTATLYLSAMAVSALGVVSVAGPARGLSPAASQDWLHSGGGSAGPSARYDASMVYDAATRNTVLFGGSGSAPSAETWTWNGSGWTQMSPGASPPALRGAAMAYDAFTHDVVLFGGLTAAGATNGTWTWDGTTWTQQQIGRAHV